MSDNNSHSGPDVSLFPDWLIRALAMMGSDVVDPGQGYVVCPGIKKHTTPNAPRDCKLYHNEDGSRVMYCVHQSCKEIVARANAALRAEQSEKRPTRSHAARLIARARAQDAARKRARYTAALPDILRSHSWPQARIIAESPVRISAPPCEHWRHIVQLFQPDDTVWCGGIYDSRQLYHASCFRTAANWLKTSRCPGAYTCPWTFQPGVCSRKTEFTVARPFLVVESDLLDRNHVGAVFHWLERGVGLTLRAIVDTAGRSLHGWFDTPAPELLEELRVALPLLKCDPAMFRPAQPCRLPGALRDGNYQRLIYLS